MGDPEGFVECSVYAILVAVALPFVKHFEHYCPALATPFLVLAIAPIPIWLVGARLGMPDWLVRLVIWDCWFVLACIAAMLISLAVLKLVA